MFQQISRLTADPILGLMANFRADPSATKVDLGVGVFRDLSGATPVLDCVRIAEQRVLSGQTTKSYVSPAGREEFNAAVEDLVLGSAHAVRRDRRSRTVQTPGGSGALKVGAELIRTAAPTTRIHVSDPTWLNHIPLLGSAGLPLERYPYYDPLAHALLFDRMIDQLNQAPAGDVVLVHGCCHNPTGADLSVAQWSALAELFERRSLVPFLDLAYQGFGADLESDVAGVRLLAERLPELLIATSYSKNLGLYRERVGALIVISESEARADAVLSQMLRMARSLYSMPPDHGAAIAACIFSDAALRAGWVGELGAMRDRIKSMRALLASSLRKIMGTDSFDFIDTQRGMFSLLGVSTDIVDRLRERHHIYMTADSRMNLAGIMPHNAAYVAEALAAELAATR